MCDTSCVVGGETYACGCLVAFCLASLAAGGAHVALPCACQPADAALAAITLPITQAYASTPAATQCETLRIRTPPRQRSASHRPRECRREPRAGQRLTLAATVATPAGPLLLYSAHLEVFCGPVGRLQQFADILAHSRAAAADGTALQVIGGDLNTLGHGVARLSPYHCTDHLRWATLGQTEAAFWQANLFDVPEAPDAPVRRRCSAHTPKQHVPRCSMRRVAW
jgi:endonuclease/exonuclease/phosphatase family metal-dependent hydrolase